MLMGAPDKVEAKRQEDLKERRSLGKLTKKLIRKIP